MKNRSDSLFARLKRAGKLDEFFAWLYAEEPSYTGIQDRLKSWNLAASLGAIHNLISVNGWQWRVESARAAAEAGRNLLPESAPDDMRRRTEQIEFELRFAALSTKEKMALLKLDVERQKMSQSAQQLRLDRDRFQFDAAKAALAQLPALRAIAGDRSLNEDAKLIAVRKQLFGEVPE